MICDICKLEFKDSDIVRCVRFENDLTQIKPLTGEIEIEYETGRIKRPQLVRKDFLVCKACRDKLKKEEE